MVPLYRDLLSVIDSAIVSAIVSLIVSLIVSVSLSLSLCHSLSLYRDSLLCIEQVPQRDPQLCLLGGPAGLLERLADL